MARVFIGIGSNIAPETHIREALFRLAAAVRIVGISTIYLTEPLGQVAQPRYYNGVVEVETNISPDELKFGVLRRIEDELGRQRGEDKYAPRPIDLDLLLYGDLLPDPEIFRRSFLATPLCELAPELVVPGSGQRVCALAEQLGREGMEALPEYSAELRRELIHE